MGTVELLDAPSAKSLHDVYTYWVYTYWLAKKGRQSRARILSAAAGN